MPSRLPHALAGLLAVLLALEIFIVLPRLTALAIVGIGVWLALPGVALVRALVGPERTLLAWLMGPALGIGFSVFGLLLVWLLGLKGWMAFALAPALTWAIVWLATHVGGPPLRLPSFDRRDVAAVLLALLVVPLVTWKPYDHVREPVAEGEAYRAYFTADFIWAMTVTSTLANGDLPPANPFLDDQPLYYYWMAHFLSGSLYHNLRGGDVGSEPIVLIDGLLFGLAFVAFAYGLARLVGGGPWASALAVAAAFVANSYEGADMIRAIVAHGQPWTDLRIINIDAVSRWFYRGMAVDGLQRLLLYQPHHLTGYALALSALWLVGLAERVSDTAVALWAGILLALALLFSTFAAIMVGAAVGLVFALRLLQQGSVREVVGCAILGAVPVGVGVAVTNALGYTDTRFGSLLILGLNQVALNNASWVIFISFGPLLLAGAASLLRGRWLLERGAIPLALVIVAFAFYFFTNVPDSGDVWVGWRSGHMLLITFAAMAASTLTAAWQAAARWRPALAALVVLLLVPAVPTVAIDVYNAQDIANREEGPGFPWTLVITPAEREALEWIRRSTAPDAVVQLDPTVRGAGNWAYMQAFAERRGVAGLPIAMTPLRPYQDASELVRGGVFRAPTADAAYRAARDLGIDYLAAGRPEQRAYGRAIALIETRPDLFEPVFRNEALTIFRVRS